MAKLEKLHVEETEKTPVGNPKKLREGYKAVVNTLANIRNAPSAGSSIVTTAKKGDKIVVKKEINGYGQITENNYILLSLIDKE